MKCSCGAELIGHHPPVCENCGMMAEDCECGQQK
jgi:hypothetical protein